MKRILTLRVISVLAAVLLLLLAFSVVYAHGHTADQLAKAGWACDNAGPHNWVHCFKKNPTVQPAPPTIQIKVFGEEGHPFLGTEILVRPDVYKGQPCAQDGGEEYDTVVLGPNTWRACHHFDTDH
jgi:hypothetical protein